MRKVLAIVVPGMDTPPTIQIVFLSGENGGGI